MGEIERIPAIRCKTCGVIYSPMCEHMRYPNLHAVRCRDRPDRVGEVGEGFAVVSADIYEEAVAALRLYGTHLLSCALYAADAEDVTAECDCGFATARSTYERQ